MQQQFVIFLLLNCFVVLISGQGPFPPRRLTIPGAVALPLPESVQPLRSQYRNENKVVRVRRPVGIRQQNSFASPITQRLLEDSKPVTEAPEEEDRLPDAFLPTLLREQQLAQAQQAQFQQAAAAFLNHEPNGLQDLPTSPLLLQHDEPSIVSQTIHHSPTPAPSPLRPDFNDFGIGSNIGASQRFGPERPQPPLRSQQQPQHQQPQTPPPRQTRPNALRSRPVFHEPPRAQFEVSEPATQPPPPPPRARPTKPRPVFQQNQIQDDREQNHQQQSRRQKPVAQTIRKWREENEDGSITWGYENDDGSFKEEIIGMDCITKGTFGYIDPDGNKREYQYETGIKCDPNTRQTEDEIEENGFINYEENKAVLPNGIEIDMSQLGKKKSKRPGAYLRN